MGEIIRTNTNQLFVEIKQLINESRQQVAQTINIALTATYWGVGKKISQDILKNSRADYGKQIVHSLSALLVDEYGRGFSKRNLFNMIRFAEVFPEHKIVSALWKQLSWSHFKILIYLDTDLKKEYYTQLCRLEQWSTRTLQKKIDSMLFERTTISKKPEELAKLELSELSEKNKFTLDLALRDHYILDFLNLENTYSENDLESAILHELENFILELGIGFTFVARQKRMIIDNTDFYLDLLFYHRKLKRLIAIELKIGKFKPAYKGQMELYLRWLEKNEKEAGEEQPVGLILCAEGNQEQIKLLQLDKANIKVSEYITKQLPKELLARKLNQFTETAKKLIENRAK